MAKNDAHYITPRTPDKGVKAYISGFTRRYSHIATVVYSWQTETGKLYCYMEPIDNKVSMLNAIPDK